MKTLDQALAETPEQFAARMSERAEKQEADHATRKEQAYNEVELTVTRDGDDLDFTGDVWGMTIKGYASYAASYDPGEADVGLFPGWDIDELEIKTLEIHFGLGIKIIDIPKDSPTAKVIHERLEAWLTETLDGEVPDDSRDDD
jgi:hypothetical protein